MRPTSETLRDFSDIESGRIAEHFLYLGALMLFALHVLVLHRLLRTAHPAATLFGTAIAEFGLAIMTASSLLHVATSPLADLYAAPDTPPEDLKSIEYAWHGAQSVFDTMLTTGALLVPIGMVLLGVAMRHSPAFGAGLTLVTIGLGTAGMIGAAIAVVDPGSIFSAVSVLAIVVFVLSTGWRMLASVKEGAGRARTNEVNGAGQGQRAGCGTCRRRPASRRRPRPSPAGSGRVVRSRTRPAHRMTSASWSVVSSPSSGMVHSGPVIDARSSMAPLALMATGRSADRAMIAAPTVVQVSIREHHRVRRRQPQGKLVVGQPAQVEVDARVARGGLDRGAQRRFASVARHQEMGPGQVGRREGVDQARHVLVAANVSDGRPAPWPLDPAPGPASLGPARGMPRELPVVAVTDDAARRVDQPGDGVVAALGRVAREVDDAVHRGEEPLAKQMLQSRMVALVRLEVVAGPHDRGAPSAQDLDGREERRGLGGCPHRRRRLDAPFGPVDVQHVGPAAPCVLQ